jgi:HD-like signal output (HDOD) protein
MTTNKLDQARISKMVTDMPAFPRSVQEVLALTNDINCAPRDLVRVIEHDPVLRGRVCKLVNSAYFGLSRRIDSVKEAIAYVGLNTLKHLAMSVAAIGALPKKNKAGLRMDEFLNDSLAVGAVARWLTPRLGLGTRDGDDLFLAGLVHKIGQVVLALHMPKVFRAIRQRSKERGIPQHELELQVLGTTHFELGALVALKWNLQEHIVGAVRHHWLYSPDVERSVWMDGLFGATWLLAMSRTAEVAPQFKPVSECYEAFETRLGGPAVELLLERQSLQDAVKKTKDFAEIT